MLLSHWALYNCAVEHTGFGEGHDIGHISHEDPALELQLGVLIPDFGALGPSLVFLVLALTWRKFFAAEKDGLEKIDLILS